MRQMAKQRFITSYFRDSKASESTCHRRSRPAKAESVPDDLLITDYFQPAKTASLARPSFGGIENLLDALPGFEDHALDAFRSNAEPSEEQQAQSRSQLDSLLTASASVQQELLRLKVAIVRLKAETRCWRTLQCRLDDAVEMYRCMSAPIRRLPDEILCEIFEPCAAADRASLDMDSTFRLVRIVRVCRRWREAALACPTLWRYINDDCHIQDEADITSVLFGSGTVARARMFLRFSGNQTPLSVFFEHAFDARYSSYSVDDDDPEYSEGLPLVSAFIDTMMASSHRWKTLELGYNMAETRAFLERIQSRELSFPILSRVHLSASEFHVPGRTISFPTLATAFLESLPVLKHFHMAGLVIYGAEQMALTFGPGFAPWSRLRSCKLEWCRGEDIFLVLPLFSNQASLFLSHISLNTAARVHTSISTFIYSLKLEFCRPQFTAALFMNLTAPNLSDIRICRQQLGPWVLFSDFVHRSGCRLRRLQLDASAPEVGGNKELMMQNLIQFFRSPRGSGLVELELAKRAVARPLVVALVEQDALLPDLRSLELYYRHSGPQRLCEESLVVLHQKRPNLRSLRLYSDSQAFSGISPATVGKLKAGGVHIELVLYDPMSHNPLVW
ncbi:F-box domain-containing protein [Mycena chlorophos]|uniref:F-box domain-containing protein n=1 Tax=Mycena chlorophos TaxID=658473 RepID=A0A8H6TFV8_MYCCL|nr:F-box domain-containing protein [Mycena chlorophos]